MCVTVSNFIKIGETVAQIWQFNGFQNGGRPPSWICEIRIFNRRLTDPFGISVPNFITIAQTLSEISRFFLIFKMLAAAIFGFRKFEIFTVGPL